jgi:phage/plasmid-like protein (TIGR03299 family)
MSHEVESMAYVGRKPWHGIGTEVEGEECQDAGRVLKAAGLDWEVELVPLVTHDEQQPVQHKAVRRTTDSQVLGVVGPRYHPLQNAEAFAWFEPFVASGMASFHTAGSLRGGTRVWVLAQVGGRLNIVPGDQVERFVLLSHSHDGNLAVRVGFTPIRVVCANTLAVAHGDSASKLVRVRHTRSVKENLVAVREVMDLVNAEFEATAAQYRRLAKKPINQSDVRTYVKQVVLAEGDEKKWTPQTQKLVGSIEVLVADGTGNDLPGVRGTLWAAYNGVAEYLSYERGKPGEGRLDALWFGEGAVINRRALDVALSMAG